MLPRPAPLEALQAEGGVAGTSSLSNAVTADGVLLAEAEVAPGLAAVAEGAGWVPRLTGPGAPGWARVKEGGVHFSFDITRVMFCSGNVTERMRMGRVDAAGETVVDLYAGIGYYTLNFLKHGGAAVVHACEWNPNSLLALRSNLAANGVADRCVLPPGDNAVTARTLRGVADRVCLGLLPSSEGGWVCGAMVLKAAGGAMHLHENVHDASLGAWRAEMLRAVAGHLRDQHGGSWDVTCEHTERVKSYRPRVGHYVFDLRCRPAAGSEEAP